MLGQDASLAGQETEQTDVRNMKVNQKNFKRIQLVLGSERSGPVLFEGTN